MGWSAVAKSYGGQVLVRWELWRTGPPSLGAFSFAESYRGQDGEQVVLRQKLPPSKIPRRTGEAGTGQMWRYDTFGCLQGSLNHLFPIKRCYN